MNQGINFELMGLEPVSAELKEVKGQKIACITCKKGPDSVVLYTYPLSLSPAQRSALKIDLNDLLKIPGPLTGKPS